jgi:hypothetical protein
VIGITDVNVVDAYTIPMTLALNPTQSIVSHVVALLGRLRHAVAS